MLRRFSILTRRFASFLVVVKKGKITKLHSQVYVYVRWDKDMWNKKVNKAKVRNCEDEARSEERSDEDVTLLLLLLA